MMLLNLNAEPTTVAIRFAASTNPGCYTSATARVYTVEAGPESRAGSSILLNGKILEFTSSRATMAPNLTGVLQRCDYATLPAHSVAWYVIN